jgi:hypothetical protein
MMNEIMLKTPQELLIMSAKSALKGADIIPKKWVECLMNVLTKK